MMIMMRLRITATTTSAGSSMALKTPMMIRSRHEAA
jgi:hypothetical protein